VVKILSQGGRSLADQYDVEGSIAGIDDLESREVTLVHEMGATLFSERMRTTFRSSNVIASQSLAFIIPITNFPPHVSRILGIQVLTDDQTRLNDVQVSVTDPIAGGGQDFPIWVWEGTHRVANVAMAGVTTLLGILQPEPGSLIPTFVLGDDQGSGGNMRNITLRGNTNAFGAGTVTTHLLVHFAFTFTGGVSGFGSKVPSW